MNHRRQSVLPILCFLLSLAATPALGNPMSMNVVRGVQVPGTFHVQLTYTCLECSDDTAETMVVIKDDSGNALALQPPETVSANHGSGVDTATAVQACVCDLEPGTYTYHFEPTGDMGWNTDISVSVVDPPPTTDPVDAGPTDGGSKDAITMDEDTHVDPWDEPEPPWPQGVDCVAVCDAPVVIEVVERIEPTEDVFAQVDTTTSLDTGAGSETTANADSATQDVPPGEEPATEAETQDDSPSCSVSPVASAAPLALLALLVLSLLWRRQTAA